MFLVDPHDEESKRKFVDCWRLEKFPIDNVDLNKVSRGTGKKSKK